MTVDALEKNPRVEAVLAAATAAGLITGTEQKRLSGRAHEALVAAAIAKSGLEGNDLLEYALARVAIEDDFVVHLLARAGSIPADIDLEI